VAAVVGAANQSVDRARAGASGLDPRSLGAFPLAVGWGTASAAPRKLLEKAGVNLNRSWVAAATGHRCRAGICAPEAVACLRTRDVESQPRPR
jgi:hypothetical protein